VVGQRCPDRAVGERRPQPAGHVSRREQVRVARIRVVLLGPPSFLNGLLMHGTIFQLTLTFRHPTPLNVK